MSEIKKKTHSRKKAIISLVFAGVIILSAAVFFIYMENYYHADNEALKALISDENVTVTQTESGWLFDGAGDNDLLIFYPGAKVEEQSYAPLMRSLSENGIDTYLVKMPFRFALFGINKADDIIGSTDYAHYYVGGHSLGGAMSAVYASDNGEKLNGLVLLAAYPTKPLDNDLTEIIVYGSDDTVLNVEKVIEGRKFQTDNYTEYVIEGGNHAEFGNYGEQKGDGQAKITAEKQQSEAVTLIIDKLLRKTDEKTLDDSSS